MSDSLSQKLLDTERVRDAAGGESNTDVNEPRTATTLPEKSREALRLADVKTEVSLLGRLHQWWIFFVAGMLLLIFAPPTLLVCWLIRRREGLYPMAMWGARQWLRLSGMRVVVRGREQLDAQRSYIFIANHRSYLDTATLFAYTGRRIGLFAKKELLKVPILGYGMGYVNIMAIDRSNRERALTTVRAATERIRSGISFGVFAEGTRARPGELLPFKKGAFYMAIETGVPIVPVAMKHTDGLMGKGTGVARAGTIEMVILPPIETTGLSTDEDVKRLSAEVRARVAEELKSRG
ncbi:MAG: 1-acyl-sn-glycerol-3-phosphate acyltransferase [Acidobacteria bacterium]|nr:1-acyl-sn-glycerol-3-phosphate acyltransferase [Acidobacteriota bacterium]